MTYATQPRTPVHSLQVATNLHHFIESQVLPDTGISAHHFWQGFDALVSGTLESMQKGWHAGTAEGAALELLPLPYPLLADI